MKLWDCYLRWRHSRGFGVHSPYAYRFITNVLRPGPYIYYSYHEVDRWLQGPEKCNHKFERFVLFTIRLAIFLKSKRILVLNSKSRLSEVTAAALKLPCVVIRSRNKVNFKEGDLLIIDKSDCNNSLLDRAIKEYVAVFAISPGPETREFLETPVPKGLLLNGKDRMILIPRQEMEYVSYNLNLGGGI